VYMELRGHPLDVVERLGVPRESLAGTTATGGRDLLYSGVASPFATRAPWLLIAACRRKIATQRVNTAADRDAATRIGFDGCCSAGTCGCLVPTQGCWTMSSVSSLLMTSSHR
jgi:hypothetical protein